MFYNLVLYLLEIEQVLLSNFKLPLQVPSLIGIFVTFHHIWSPSCKVQSSVSTYPPALHHHPPLCHWHIDDNQPSHCCMSILLHGMCRPNNISQPGKTKDHYLYSGLHTLVLHCCESLFCLMCECCCCSFTWAFLIDIGLRLKDFLYDQGTFT